MGAAYAILHEENGQFGVSFPDFPGCVTGGATADEAVRKADEALTFHVAGMVEDGDRLPFLRSISELSDDAEFIDSMKDGILFISRFETPGKSVRINISIDENLLADVDKAAAATGQSRSAFLAHAARDRIRA